MHFSLILYKHSQTIGAMRCSTSPILTVLSHYIPKLLMMTVHLHIQGSRKRANLTAQYDVVSMHREQEQQAFVSIRSYACFIFDVSCSIYFTFAHQLSSLLTFPPPLASPIHRQVLSELPLLSLLNLFFSH